MTQPGEILYPPDTVEEPEINVHEILEDWEGFDGVEPAHITALRATQSNKGESGDDNGMLLPPGVS